MKNLLFLALVLFSTNTFAQTQSGKDFFEGSFNLYIVTDGIDTAMWGLDFTSTSENGLGEYVSASPAMENGIYTVDRLLGNDDYYVSLFPVINGQRDSRALAVLKISPSNATQLKAGDNLVFTRGFVRLQRTSAVLDVNIRIEPFK